MAPYAAKSAEQAARIAGVLTLAANPASRTIDADAMVSGIALAQWYLGEALRLREDGITSPDILRAEKLLAWCRTKCCEVISVRLIENEGPNSLRENKIIEATISTLEDHGWLVKVPGGATIDGKHATKVWRVIPCPC